MRRLFEGGVYSRVAFILLGNMTRAAYPGSAHSTQPKFCQQAGKTFGVAADACGAINTETASLLAGVSEDDDDDPFAGLEEDEDELAPYYCARVSMTSYFLLTCIAK